jgi:hypothetical protein
MIVVYMQLISATASRVSASGVTVKNDNFFWCHFVMMHFVVMPVAQPMGNSGLNAI